MGRYRRKSHINGVCCGDAAFCRGVEIACHSSANTKSIIYRLNCLVKSSESRDALKAKEVEVKADKDARIEVAKRENQTRVEIAKPLIRGCLVL